MTNLPIYQPQDLNGKPLGKAFSTEAVAWEAAEAIGADQIQDLLWTACIFDVAAEAATKRIARQHRLCDHRYYCMRTVGDTPYWE